MWTSDKRYIVQCDVGIAPGYTLTIQPGTEVRFAGNYNLNVGRTLIADGTAEQPIRFASHTGGAWGRIFFDDPSTDAQATSSGDYQSGNLLRYVHIESAGRGIACTNATPFLEHVTLSGGGMNCAAGVTALWVKDSDLRGGVQTSGSAPGSHLLRTTVQGNLNLPAGSQALSSTVIGGGISIGGNGIVENSTVHSGNISVGSGSVLTSTVIGGGIVIGGGVANGNNVENAPGWGIQASGTVTLAHNRVVGCANGIQVGGGVVRANQPGRQHRRPGPGDRLRNGGAQHLHRHRRQRHPAQLGDARRDRI